MFEFTALGLLVSAVGTAYLLPVGRWLTPARIPPREDLTDEFELEECPTEVVVEDDSPLVGRIVADALAVVVGGVLKPPEVYEAVEWDVIFLLAGVIPLGIAMEKTGGADLLADLVVASADVLLAIAVLGLFYVVTALLTNVISNNASVVLMISVAAEAAARLDANAFAFVLSVTFAASTAFMTPVGYQTNLFVHGPSGYRFTDYVRVGAPLQLLFAIATTAGIAVLWGV